MKSMEKMLLILLPVLLIFTGCRGERTRRASIGFYDKGHKFARTDADL